MRGIDPRFPAIINMAKHINVVYAYTIYMRSFYAHSIAIES